MVQWIRIRLPIQGTWVQPLIWEDSICRGVTKLVCYNYWAHGPQQEKPPFPIPHSETVSSNEDPVQPKISKKEPLGEISDQVRVFLNFLIWEIYGSHSLQTSIMFWVDLWAPLHLLNSHYCEFFSACTTVIYIIFPQVQDKLLKIKNCVLVISESP